MTIPEDQPDAAAPGRTGHNTISRAELGAYFKRRGHDHGGDAAAAVFDNIRAHRGPEPEPAETADARSALADADNAIGQVIRLAESWRMAGGRLDASHVTGVLLDICAPWTGGLRIGAQEGSNEEGDGR